MNANQLLLFLSEIPAQTLPATLLYQSHCSLAEHEGDFHLVLPTIQPMMFYQHLALRPTTCNTNLSKITTSRPKEIQNVKV